MFRKGHLFWAFEENIIFPCIFFWERLSFIFRLNNKIIFLGKGNIIFPDNIRKTTSQCNFFRKTIFSENLKKNWLFLQLWIILLKNFPVIFFFLWIIYSFSAKFIYKRHIFWYFSRCFPIYLWFNATVAASWKHLSSSLIGLI